MSDSYTGRAGYAGQYRERFGDEYRGNEYRGSEYGMERSRRGSRRHRVEHRVERGVQEHTFPPNRRMPIAESDATMDDLQRWVSGVGGAALLWYGLKQRGISGWSLSALGAGLLYQGVAGDNLLDRIPIAQEIPIVREMTSEPTQLRIRKSLTVNKPAEKLYAYWRNLSNLPHFMSHVKSVQEIDTTRSHWVVQVLNDMELEWDAHITVDNPNEMIAWETLPEATVQNRGYVKFIPTARGTEVSVSIEYDPPGAAAGRLAGRTVQFITEQQVKEDIRNFKRLMETGTIPTTKGQPAARKDAWQQSARLQAQRQWQGDSISGMSGSGSMSGATSSGVESVPSMSDVTPATTPSGSTRAGEGA